MGSVNLIIENNLLNEFEAIEEENMFIFLDD